jgi:hypothetical protein
MNDLTKFKELLSWFVNQLKINNGVISGAHTSGQGYEDHAIRKLYEKWRSYNGFDLDCSIQSGFQKDRRANYIHLSNEKVNIIPIFDNSNAKSDVVDLQIVVIGTDNVIVKECGKKSVVNLDLLNGNSPNAELKDFFEELKQEIRIYLIP